jgi:hypothetical protein
MALLPKRLADVQDEIGTEHIRLSTLNDVRDQLDVERLGRNKHLISFRKSQYESMCMLILADLQRCREEREKIIAEESLGQSVLTRAAEPRTILLLFAFSFLLAEIRSISYVTEPIFTHDQSEKQR